MTTRPSSTHTLENMDEKRLKLTLIWPFLYNLITCLKVYWTILKPDHLQQNHQHNSSCQVQVQESSTVCTWHPSKVLPNSLMLWCQWTSQELLLLLFLSCWYCWFDIERRHGSSASVDLCIYVSIYLRVSIRRCVVQDGARLRSVCKETSRIVSLLGDYSSNTG